MTPLLRRLAHTALASALVIGTGAPAGAQEMFEVARPSAAGNYLAGREALRDLSTEEAARYLSAAALAEWDNPLVIDRAFIALAADGQIGQAASSAKHLLEIDPSNELARLVIATEALKEQRYPAALKALEGMGVDTQAGVAGLVLRAWALVGAKRADEALDELAAPEAPGLENFFLFHRALVADVAGETELATELAAEAYKVAPQDPQVIEAYARILGNAGKFDEAINVILPFEAQGLSSPLVDVVKAQLEAKRRPGPLAANLQAGAAAMYLGTGLGLARTGTVDYAVVFLRLGMYLDPRADVITVSLGRVLELWGQFDEANAIYSALPETSPLKPTAVVRAAQNLEAIGNRAEAIRRLRNIAVSRPDDLEAASVLADLLRADEQYGEAVAAYTKVLDIAGGDRPADWRFYYYRGIAYERDGKFDKAEPDFLKALELNPNQPQVLNYLGYTWVDRGVNLNNALAMIQKAVDASPTDGYIVDSLGWAYYKLGRYGEAVAALEQAVQLQPTDPEINDHLGDAYWRAGRKLEAKFQWNIAMSVDDEDGNVKKRVLPKLTAGLDGIPVTPASTTVPDPVMTPAPVVQ